jgi:hypothetical protein
LYDERGEIMSEMVIANASPFGSGIMKRLLLLSRLVLGFVFGSSGVLKLISPHDAAGFLAGILSLGSELSTIVVVFGSILEIALGAVFLFVRRQIQTAVLISATMMLVFTAMGVAEIDNPKPCGCFGGFLESKTDEVFFARNIALLFLSMFLLRHQEQPINN